MTVRVLIADDQHLVRTGLKVILDSEPDIEVIGEATHGREAVSMTRELRPDVAVMTFACPNSMASRRPNRSPHTTANPAPAC
jgi:DNA-binding NarL/FixJ family response regulator